MTDMTPKWMFVSNRILLHLLWIPKIPLNNQNSIEVSLEIAIILNSSNLLAYHFEYFIFKHFQQNTEHSSLLGWNQRTRKKKHSLFDSISNMLWKKVPILFRTWVTPFSIFQLNTTNFFLMFSRKHMKMLSLLNIPWIYNNKHYRTLLIVSNDIPKDQWFL